MVYFRVVREFVTANFTLEKSHATSCDGMGVLRGVSIGRPDLVSDKRGQAICLLGRVTNSGHVTSENRASTSGHGT